MGIIKRILLTCGLALAAALVVMFMIYVYPWLVLWLGLSMMPNPPKPEITYGEFPFELVYELDGEIKVVKDVLICEFDGFNLNTGRGKNRQWKTRTESGEDRITLLYSEGIEIFFPSGTDKGDLYMGDPETHAEDVEHPFPNAYYNTPPVNGIHNSSYIISAEDMWEKYSLKLISWKPSQPIQNSFK